MGEAAVRAALALTPLVCKANTTSTWNAVDIFGALKRSVANVLGVGVVRKAACVASCAVAVLKGEARHREARLCSLTKSARAEPQELLAFL
jgi:hypothetical protein